MRSLLLVEDDARLGAAFASVLEARRAGAWTVRVVSSAAAARATADRAIDLAIVDLGLPDASGVDVIAELAQRTPPIRALAFTVFDDRATVLAAVEAGAVGYLLKDDPVDRVIAQIEECLDGHTPVSSRVARYLFDLGRKPADVALTDREEEVLACLRRGSTYTECAEELGLRLGTVQTHVKNLYRKLDVTTKTEAAAWAQKNRRG
ncbi:MAG: response regulator transcription factor [Labilithrix sp.]|nr:response regulator transcription factor [Labilithrix sp.]MCW5816762.1 response regulator transcription factor [Labilithrix sp.]